MGLQRWFLGWGMVVVLLLAGCGGDPGAGSAREGVPRKAAPAPVTATEVMDWAEANYPQFFPGPQANQAYLSYTYRYYPSTGNYLGLAGSDIYIMGTLTGGMTPQRVGATGDFYCQLRAGECLSGTAAVGAALAGATVTVIDSQGNSASAVTSAQGSYQIATSTSALGAAPWLVRVTPATGTVLYSVTADAAPTVANITPWTDLIVRTWYGVQGVSPATAFAAPASYPPPNPTQVGTVAQPLLSVAQLGINVHGAAISEPQHFINQAFSANGTGTDLLLENTQVTVSGTSGATVVVQAGSTTQTTALAYSTSTSSVTADTTATDGVSTTTSSLVQVVPVASTQASAIDEINARLAAFAAVVNSKGASLTAADVIDFYTEDALDGGLTRDQIVSDLVTDFSEGGQTISLSVQRVERLDTVAGEAELIVRFRQTLGSAVDVDDEYFRMRKVSGLWRLTGDGRIAQVGVTAEARRNQGTYTQNSGPSINIDVRPLKDTASAVTVSSSVLSATLTQGPTEITDSGVQLSTFNYNTGTLTGTLPQAGTPFTLTLTRSSGGTVSYTVALNAFTNEMIQITSPTGTSLSQANLGGTLPVSWTLPVTYAIQRVRLGAFVFTDTANNSNTLSCDAEAGVLGTNATTGNLQLPATCGGQPVKKVNISVNVDGVNGERSQVIYTLQ